ncbi:MAG: hypothetical protein ACFFDI_12895, partial [Promethearchaeota archaeon]
MLENIGIMLLLSIIIGLVPSPALISDIEVESNEQIVKCPVYTIPQGSISIIEILNDCLYAWDKLQTRRDMYGPNQTSMYFKTEVVSNSNYSQAYSVELLPTFYAMYKITNDSSYLDAAWEMFQDILTYCLGRISRENKTGEVLFRYNWETDQIDNSSVNPITVFVPIALEDPRYIPYFERLIAGSHELFWSPANLIYKTISIDGTILASDQHITWGPSTHRKIIQLFWMYEVTGNETYKQWADETIEAIWAIRSTTTNLIPRMVDSITGEVRDSSISHYDMAGWLNALELAYIITGRNNSEGTGSNTYYDLIFKAAKAITTYMWRSNRWVYRCTYSSGAQSSTLPEMNSVYVDYALIRAYEITGEEEFLQKAIIDFDTEYMGSDPVVPNGLLMHRSLVIHSPATYSTQSQFMGSSNLMFARTAYLMYLYTRNETYLKKNYVHYRQLMSKHRFEKGYTHLLDTANMQPYPLYNGLPAIVFDLAPTKAIFAFQNAFIPSENVSLDLGYGLSTSSPNGYGVAGALPQVTVDVNQQLIQLDIVAADSEGYLFVNYSRGASINHVKIDGQPYTCFEGNTLFCEEGTHTYRIFFEISTLDSDSDGLSDWNELNVFHTDPFNPDTDSDELLDGLEISTYFTDPLNNDTDVDGLLDGLEISTYFTDPLNNDTDVDGLLDG